MLFQQTTPDTSGYMIAGYVVAFVVMGLYVASMYLRSRNLKQEMTMLDEMDKPDPAPVQKQSIPKPAGMKNSKPVTKKSVKN